MLLRLLSLLLCLLASLPGIALGFELQPLVTRNLSPSVIGFGLPSLGAARVLTPGSGQGQLIFDLISNSTEKTTSTENLLFDGESYRLALAGDYGYASGLEFGFALPLISHQGGVLDSFIENWHDAFGLPQGIRDQTAHNQLDYSYLHQNGAGFSVQSDQAGIGDLSLRTAWQLFLDDDKRQAIAMRASLKLPTGSAEKLTGSGSTDFAVWLSGEQRQDTIAGQLFLYGGGGLLASSDGDLLSGQRRNLVGFFTLGCGLQIWPKLGFQLQFDGHSPFSQASELRELTDFSGQLAIGGSLALGSQTVLELAVIEDVVVATAPDVVFHFALSHHF